MPPAPDRRPPLLGPCSRKPPAGGTLGRRKGAGVGRSLTDSSARVSLLQRPGPLESLRPASSAQPPQWRCYARLVNPQHVFLTFLPATFPGTNHRPLSLSPSDAGEGLSPRPAGQLISAPFPSRCPASGCLWPGGAVSRGDKAQVRGRARGLHPERSGRSWGQGCRAPGPHPQCHPGWR